MKNLSALFVTTLVAGAAVLALGLAACSDPGDDIPPALAKLYQQAQAGDAAAQLDPGLRYVTGTGIVPDERAALRWIGNAAAQGNAAEPGERDARDLAPGLQAELSAAELQQARDRALRYRQRPL